jgi:hypothetical protein
MFSMKIKKFPVLLAMASFSSIPFFFAVLPTYSADFTFSANFSNGYSAQGFFTTKSNAPASFSEISPGFAPFVTQFLQSQSLSIFDSTNTLLQSGSPIINGISTDQYFRLDYDNSLTPNLPVLDVNTETPSQNPYYFIANDVDISGAPIPPNSTDYKLFLYDRVTNSYTFLGSTPSIQATAVPETSSVISLLGLAALGVTSIVKSRLSNQ